MSATEAPARRVGAALRRGLVLVLALAGCGRGLTGAINDDDDPDLVAARQRFACADARSPRAQEACAAIDAFEAGGPVTAYPAEGQALYLGRALCARESDDTVVFEVLSLAPGRPPGEVDDAHLPGGVIAVSMHAFARTTPLQPAPIDAGVERILEALRRGDPDYDLGLPAGHALPPSFAAFRARARDVPRTPHPTARSRGVSLLDGPGRVGARWDDFDRSSALHYLREVPGGLVRLSPRHDAPPGNACVTRFYPLP